MRLNTILITGGTGSFGNKFISCFRKMYKKVIIFSRDELKQYEMEKIYPFQKNKNLRFFLGDIRDKDRLKFALKDVDIVLHAAALKQVPRAEYNPIEYIKTNVLGAQNIIETSLETNVKKVIALSTDKASSPINLYGATKLASDKLFVAANNISSEESTRFAVVRYGNVVGSRGSVVPYFTQLLKDGADHFPITHEKMTRFWITLQSGVHFVLKNFERMSGGEIFVPKIPSIRILDLAKSIAPDMPIEIVGIRPGEKLDEVMCPADDSHHTIEYDDHFVIAPSVIFYSTDFDFTKNQLGESGEYVEHGFEYQSGTNDHFLSIDEIKEYN